MLNDFLVVQLRTAVGAIFASWSFAVLAGLGVLLTILIVLRHVLGN